MGDNFKHLENQNQVDNEITLSEILSFLKGAYKTILIFSLVGLAIAVAYLAVAPHRYEAIARIAMAQTRASNNGINPLGVNVEDPPLLIIRLSSAFVYPAEVLSACDTDGVDNSGLVFSKTIKLQQIKNVNNILELRAFGKSPEVASICALAIFEFIKTTQAQILAPFIKETKAKLLDYEHRLASAKAFVTNVDKASQTVGVAYLAMRDEIRYLSDEITLLRDFLISSNDGVTKLIVPIYADKTPISPKKLQTLSAGILGGLLLGLLLALGRQILTKLKVDAIR